jgi:hypothetical protein
MQQLQIPPLAEGEIYVGAIGDKNGDFHHVILLPGDHACDTHAAAIDWAKSIGGDLPNRIEQAMLWANHRDLFEQDWYWSNESYHRNDASAWYQYFLSGGQGSNPKGDSICRARAVRRLPI